MARLGRLVPDAQNQLPHGSTVFRATLNAQIALGLFRSQDALLRRLHRSQNRRLAARILIDADAEVDFVWILVALKRRAQPHDGVGRRHR